MGIISIITVILGILAIFLSILVVFEYLSYRKELRRIQEAETISRTNEIKALREIFVLINKFE